MSHRSYQPIKPAASKMLAKRWDDSSYSLHRSKLRHAKATVDTRPPKTYMHLQLKLKKLQMEEERLATVERDNRILLEKMSHIMRTRGRVDNSNDYEHKSLNRTKRQQELLRIAHENQAILKRISAKQPVYDRESWKNDYDQSLQYRHQIASFPDKVPGASAT
jgi:E3 ubiquitin-protein ligase TRIP12